MADVMRTALVTGGNRGIGFEACRQLARSGLRVVLTARDPDLGTQAARQLVDEVLDVRFAPMDVGDERSVTECVRQLAEVARIQVDVLVNNAGISPGALCCHSLPKNSSTPSGSTCSARSGPAELSCRR